MGVLVRREDGSTYWDESRADPSDTGGSIVGAPAPGSGGGGGGGGGNGGGGGAPAPGSNPTQGSGNMPGFSVDSYAGRQAARDWAVANMPKFDSLAFNESVKAGANLQQGLAAGGGVTYAPAPTSAAPAGTAAPAPGSQPSTSALLPGGLDARGSDGALFSQQSDTTRSAFSALHPDNPAEAWLKEHEAGLGGSKAAPAPGSKPASPTPAAATPTTAPTENQGGQVQIMTENGAFWVTPEAAEAYNAQLTAYAAAQKEAADRAYGLEADKVSISKALADSEAAYKKALAEGQSAQLAQQAALAAIDQSYKNQLLELQRASQAQQLSIQQQQLELSRRQTRGRRGAGVRYAR